jgi:hypothetical protein
MEIKKEHLYNSSLAEFIKTLNLSDEDKEKLIANLPYLDLEERIALLEKLIKIRYMDTATEQAIKKIEDYCRK